MNPWLVCAKLGDRGGSSALDAVSEARVRLRSSAGWLQQSLSREGPSNNGPFLVSVSVACVSWSHVSEANRLRTYLYSPQQYRSQPGRRRASRALFCSSPQCQVSSSACNPRPSPTLAGVKGEDRQVGQYSAFSACLQELAAGYRRAGPG